MTTQQSVNTTAQQASQYIDLHYVSVGYLNRIRQVSPKKSKPFFAAEFVSNTNGTNRRFKVDTKGVNEEVSTVLKDLLDLPADNSRVITAAVRAGDFYKDSFTIKDGNNAGQIRHINKGRLLKLIWVKVNDVLVYGEDKEVTEQLSGIGYTDGIRYVTPIGGRTFCAMNITAFSGEKSAKPSERSYFPLTTTFSDGDEELKQAISALEKLPKPKEGEKQTITVGFRATGLVPDTYQVKKGEHKGETRDTTKAKLTMINFVSVNGEVIFKRQSDAAQPAQAEQSGEVGASVEAQAEAVEPANWELVD